jgi:hypothetical protein
MPHSLRFTKIILGLVITLGFACSLSGKPFDMSVSAAGRTDWVHLSTEFDDLEPPSASREQTAALILDVDKDGINDFVIAIRDVPGPSVVWYRRHENGWDRYIIDNTAQNIEAGGAFYDIDGDGDLDIVMGGDYRSNKIWWWENPYPNYDPNTSWVRREIKYDGANKHHDMIFGDFTGNGKDELVFWNQDARSLILAEIPPDPKNGQAWPLTTIYTWDGGAEHEGLAKADIDGDGQLDIVGGGRWFKHTGGMNFVPEIIDDSQRFTRVAVGQLKEGSRPQVVFVAGDAIGPLKWYEWTGEQWIGHDLLGFNVDHGHSLEVADIDGDGNLDIFVAEMRLNGGNPNSSMWIFYGDGQGNFTETVVATGFGNHESRIGDLTGNGKLDILGKPYNWETPRLDIWLNSPSQSLDQWERHVIDENRPGQAIFITSADIDGDGHKDIITGGYWYRNPGQPGGSWERQAIGAPLNNMAAVYDFDGDGAMDVLGTVGQGSEPNSTFYWARNDGQGNFTILDNIDPGDGDFLQGVAVERFDGENLSVALSWHEAGKGVQRLNVPADPSNQQWTWEQISQVSQDEALSAGDIDRDGRIDLLLGTIWLRNDGVQGWTPFTLYETNDSPDRNRLADMNGNGRLDAVVGYEAISQPGKLAWYEQGPDATGLWTEHIIADPPVIGPMSLDVADMDGDGDLDVIVGEHNLSNPQNSALYIFENLDGKGTEWRRHVVYVGDEHHDGAQVVDIDGDGTPDIISIGWSHGRVLLYENKGTGELILRDQELLPFVANELNPDSPSPGPTPTHEPAPSCLVEGALVDYAFDEGSGSIVHDTAPGSSPLNLTIQGDGTEWLPDGGLRVNSSSAITSSEPALKINDAVHTSNAVSIAVWIKPDNTSQEGPARIASISGDVLNRNLTLGQGLFGGQPANLYNVRLRTTSTDLNGEPSLTSPPGTAAAELSHVVYTHSANGRSVIYVNGILVAEETISGSLSNWNRDYRLILANEFDGDRPWLGEYYRVSLYGCALSASEVSVLHQAGHMGEPSSIQVPATGPVAQPAATPQPVRDTSSAVVATITGAGEPEGEGVMFGALLAAAITFPLVVLAWLFLYRKTALMSDGK